MMCFLSTATSSSHYPDEDNVDSESPRIVTSVGLPQTPPDSDPGSSPVGLPNEDVQSLSKDTVVDSLAEPGDNIESSHLKTAERGDSNILNCNVNLSTTSSRKEENCVCQKDVNEYNEETESAHNTTNEEVAIFKVFKGLSHLKNDEFPCQRTEISIFGH